MSAYVVDQSHVNFLIEAAYEMARRDHGSNFSWYHDASQDRHYLPAGDMLRAAEVGQMLWDENVKSVRFRYPDSGDELPGPVKHNGYHFDRFRFTTFSEYTPANVLKACHCYEYQSCEHPEWDTSDAKAFCTALCKCAERQVDGYEDAEWGAPKGYDRGWRCR